MRNDSKLFVLASMITFLAVCLVSCKRDVPLPDLPLSDADGTIEIVEAARPEGGATGTLAVSDMTRPPAGGDIGWWPSIAVASDGTAHLTYTDAYNGALHHAERIDGEWKITAVDSRGAVGKYTALTLSDEGVPHVVYYNQDNRLLRHAMRVGSENTDPKDRRRPAGSHEDWLFEVVDQGFEIGMAGRLLVGRDGTIHAVYYGPNERLIHAWRVPPDPDQPGRWQRRIIDDDAAGSHSIVIGLAEDSRGNLHISYSNWKVSSSDLRYGRLEQGSDEWIVEDVEGTEDAGWKSGIVIDEEDRPIVAYLVLQKRQLWIARLEEEEWSHSPLVGRANTMDLQRGEDGSLLLAYEHLPGRGLGGAQIRYLRRPNASGDLGEAWEAFEVPGGNMSTYLSLALNNRGEALVAFYRGDIRGLSVFDEGREE